MSVEFHHIPVLRDAVLATLKPANGETYVDGTFGGGGYARAVLDAADCKLIGIDRDADARNAAKAWSGNYGERLQIVAGRFGDVKSILADLGLEQVDGFVLDIGVSSPQLDRPERGFTFRADGPLDMRMDQEKGESAADLVNSLSEEDLANIIYQYGEERHSRKIARAIAKARAVAPISTTGQLADLVKATLPVSKKDKSHPATRTFQALRIAVNEELDQLTDALEAALEILKPGGRLVVVTFHSLEDRIVKNFIHKYSRPPASPSRYVPAEAVAFKPLLKDIASGGIEPSADEQEQNPRSRSSRLRAAVRLDAQLEGVTA